MAYASVNITSLLTGYDETIPPNSPGQTVVEYDFRISLIQDISEINQNFRFIVIEYMRWQDSRLVYTPVDDKS
jgi:hypothetical protein